MITNDAYKENIRSAIKTLERRMLKKTRGFFSSDDVARFIEAAMFLKERGYSLAEVMDSGRDGAGKYESLPYEDREILDGLDYPSNLSKLLGGGKAEAVISLICGSPLFQLETGPELLCPGALFQEVVRRYDTWRNHGGKIRQEDNITMIMQDLLLYGTDAGPEEKIRIYDMAMSTGTMLSETGERVRKLHPGASVVCCGQEKDPYGYVLAKAIAMLKGLEYEYVNTNVIPEDYFVGQTFPLVITGFPVEANWGDYAKEVIEEYKTIPFGRFQPGLPSVSDVQILYLLNGISKMADDGKMAIVMTDDALLDPRAKEMGNIRKYVLENDLIETIVRTKARPKIKKFGCIYLLSKKKPVKRKGRIQIINMENEAAEGKNTVLQAYKEFRNRVYENGEYTIESRIYSAKEYEEMICGKE